MGTFHDDKGELHGITVAVDTHGPTVYVGRCHEQTPTHLILLDADEHDEIATGTPKQTYLQQAARWGVFPRHKALKIPNDTIATITPLGQLS